MLILGKLYFVLVIFVGINLSIAAMTSDLKLMVGNLDGARDRGHKQTDVIVMDLPVIMWFLFGEVSSSSGCLGWATLFYCGTP